MKINFKVFLIILILQLLIKLTQTKIWTPEDLSKELKTFNSFIDPESLNEDNHLTEKIKNNYLKTNKIYDKINLNFFFISRIHNDYLYRQSLFAQVLMNNIEANPDINKENRKSSYLTIIFSLKQNIVILFPSEKLIKILPHSVIKDISEEVSSILKTKNYSKAIIYLFEKIDAYWNKYKTTNNNQNNNSQNKQNYSSRDINSKVKNVAQIEHAIYYSIVFVLLFISYCVKKFYVHKESKNDGNIKMDEKCSICLEDIPIEGNKENFLTYEEICIQDLEKENYIAILKCGHIYHATCVALWEEACEKLGDVVSCPKCRKKDLNEKREELNSQVSAITNSNFDDPNRFSRILPSPSLIEEPENDDDDNNNNNNMPEERKLENELATLDELLEQIRKEKTQSDNTNNDSSDEINSHKD